MRQKIFDATVILAIAALVASPALARRHFVEGEVIEVRLQQETQTRNRAELNELTIRTRERQELRLLLGDGPCAGCPQVGDRIRVRLMRQIGPDDELCEVRALRNLTRRERLKVRDGSGNLVRTRDRVRLGERGRAGRTQGSGNGRRGGRG